MRSRRIHLPPLIVAVAVLGLTAAAPATVAPAAEIAKKKKCKGTKIPVKTKGKTRCKKLSKALPAPQDIDPRQASVEGALGVKLKGVKDRRGRRVKPVKKKARKALLDAFPRALAGLDGLITERSRRPTRGSSEPNAAASVADCPDGPLPNGTYTESSGGVSVEAGFNADGTAQIGITFDQGGVSYRLRYETGAPCARNEVPRCPTAAGVVDSTDSRRDAITVEVLRGTQVVSSQRTSITRQTKLHGQTADDAKLDYLDVSDTWRMNVSVQGAGSLRGSITRDTRVNMRNGNYEPGETSVAISGSPQLSRADDAGFAAAVNRAIFKYRVAEHGWNEENKCAEIKWDPDYLTLTLRKGQRGGFTGRVEARDSGPPYYGGGGGTAARSRWTVTEQTNVTISPTSARGGGMASFGIVPTAAGDNVATSGRFRVTSTAGVAERGYAVKTRPDVPPPAKFMGPISGNADYDENELGEGNSLDADWGGGVNLTQTTSPIPPGFPGAPFGTYKIAAGSSIHYSYTGQVGDCHVAGNGPIDLSSQVDLANAHLLLIYEGNPRRYQLVIPMPVFAQIVGTKSDCEDPNENGEDFDWAPAVGVPLLVNAPLPGGPVGQNWNIAGTRSGDTGAGSPDQTWQWNLTASQ